MLPRAGGVDTFDPRDARMKTPFQLRKRTTSEPASALLVLASDAPTLVELCTRTGDGRWPAVYAVPGGFLLKLAQPTTDVVPHALRLRSLAANLFLPVDADLSPALLDDEATSLVSRQGLVFLPGRVLAFDVKQPLSPQHFVQPPPVNRPPWQTVPSPPALAERLSQISLDVPPGGADEILAAGGEGIGTEDPRLEDAGAGEDLLGRGQMAAGRGMMWIGNLLGLRGLAERGARWVSDALSRVPQL